MNKTYILIHGSWHGAWCWHKVTPLLEARNYDKIAIDLPGHGDDQADPAKVTLADYVARVVDTANAQAGQVILVGHSMAGIVIAQAAEVLGVDKVAKLIFVDAFIPKNGDSVFSLAEMVARQLPKEETQDPILIENIIFSEDNKTMTIKPEMAEYFFYLDCSPEDIEFAKANLSKQPIAATATPIQVTDAVYGAIPKYYILCTEAKDLDKTFLTTYVHCEKVYTLPSSHSPFFSMPVALVDIIAELQ